MSDTIVLRDNDRGPVPVGVNLGDTQLEITADLEWTDFERLSMTLFQMERSHQWWLGDLLVYGERRFGDEFAQVASISGMAVSTLIKWQWVAAAFTPERRRNSIPWSYHELLVKLPEHEQESWLDAVEREGWTKRQLARALDDTPSGDSPPRSNPTIETPDEFDQDDTIDIVERVAWTIEISIPSTSNVDEVQSRIVKSARALEITLRHLAADPQVSLSSRT